MVESSHDEHTHGAHSSHDQVGPDSSADEHGHDHSHHESHDKEHGHDRGHHSSRTHSQSTGSLAQPVTEKKTSNDLLGKILEKITGRTVLFSLLVFILAFIVRAQLMRYELFFEFDSYWHARMVSYILQGLPAPTIDPLAYYQNPAAASFANPPLFFWYVSAAIYKIFTLNAQYSQELWILFVKIIPALFGALTSVAMFFLGKELFRGKDENKAGLLAGILAAIMPAFVYRTMGGFFEDDSFGFLWMVIGFVFFVRAVRNPKWEKESIINASLSGIMFGLMALAWSAFPHLVPIFVGIGTVQFLFWLSENKIKEAKSYLGLWGISFVLMALMATLQGGISWLGQMSTFLRRALLDMVDPFYIIGPFEVLGVIILLFLFGFLLQEWCSRKESNTLVVKKLFFTTVLLLLLLPIITVVFNLSLRTGDVLGQTIGEESAGSNYFGNKYNFMTLIAVVGLPLLAYLFWKRPKGYESLVVPYVWAIFAFFMAWGKLKFTYYWGLPLALLSGVTIYLLFQRVQKHPIQTQKAVALLTGIIILGGIASGIIFVTSNVPNIEVSSGWKTALFWVNNNLPQDAKFFNWWDEGHWITFLSGRSVLIDNRNADVVATSDVAKFILSNDVNESANFVKKYGSTHLIFGDDLLEKLPNLGFYAYNITSGNDPRIQQLFGGAQPCIKNISPITRELSYQCGSNNFSEAQMSGFPVSWRSTPTTTQNGVPIFIYRTVDNARVYFFGTGANNTTLVKLWFNSEETDNFFTLIYSNMAVKIFEYDSS